MGAATERDDAVIALLTDARLTSYVRSTRTRSGAMRLYEWNLRAASAVMELTGAVEVIARNALDRELTSWADRRNAGDWLDEAPLDPRGRQDVVKAAERAARGGSRDRHDRLVAELSFGFWRYLLSSRYHASLWVPDLHRAFPRGPAELRSGGARSKDGCIDCTWLGTAPRTTNRSTSGTSTATSTMRSSCSAGSTPPPPSGRRT